MEGLLLTDKRSRQVEETGRRFPPVYGTILDLPVRLCKSDRHGRAPGGETRPRREAYPSHPTLLLVVRPMSPRETKYE